MPKLNTAALVVPAFVTVADDPGESVVVVPTAIVAAAPPGPCGAFISTRIGAPSITAWTAGIGIFLRNVRGEPFYLGHPFKKGIAFKVAEADANVTKRQ
jgi:hypothetical protein